MLDCRRPYCPHTRWRCHRGRHCYSCRVCVHHRLEVGCGGILASLYCREVLLPWDLEGIEDRCMASWLPKLHHGCFENTHRLLLSRLGYLQFLMLGQRYDVNFANISSSYMTVSDQWRAFHWTKDTKRQKSKTKLRDFVFFGLWKKSEMNPKSVGRTWCCLSTN